MITDQGGLRAEARPKEGRQPFGLGALRDALSHPRAALAMLLFASYMFRLPPLLNARSTNSDAAVVGLQAMHVLRGEHSAFLWGSGYQTSADSYAAALFFLVAGATPLVLMLSTLTLHVAATALVFATLRRRVSPWLALLLAAPLIVSPSSVHTYALYPPRQLSITLALAALWTIDGAWHRRDRSALAWTAAGSALYGFAVAADPYPMLLAPVILGYAAFLAWSADQRERVTRLGAFGGGAFVGLVPFLLLHQMARSSSGQMGLSLAVIHHNWKLLVDECLPWALSYKVYYAHNVMDYLPWDAPVVVRIVQIAGALVVGVTVTMGLLAVLRSNLPQEIRYLGFAGAMTYPIALGAFLVSVMVMDHFSMRYLAVLTLMLPFAALPVAHRLGAKRFAVWMSPHLIASAIAGWVGYGPFVRGPIPIRETPELRDDYALYDLLHGRGVQYAEADYWASYRLTFLFGEQIVVVPTHAGEDRYRPYRMAFEAAPLFAYVFDPGRSREDLAEVERTLFSSHTSVEKTHAGAHTVFIVTR